jgi:hypothetical protein
MAPWLLRLLGIVLALGIVAALFWLAFLKAGVV